MECLLLAVVVRLLKEGRVEAAARMLCWRDERVGGAEGAGLGGEDRTGSGEGGNERDGVVGKGRDWGGEDGTGSVGPI